VTAPTIYPVILSGGAGTRLWPLSRELFPKQFLPLLGEQTLLQQTALRVQNMPHGAPPIVVCNDEHRFIIAEQLRQSGIVPSAIVLEPVARNTAPAAAVAALLLAQRDPEALILLMPSDHLIAGVDVFLKAIGTAAHVAASGRLVTFGIAPQTPETGYGYIKRGAALSDGSYAVDRFVEKPDLSTAQQYLTSGDYYWNGGIFLFRATDLLAEMEALEPGIVAPCRAALAKARLDLDFTRLDKEAFAACPSRSIDYAVMEKTTRAAVVPVDMGWNDVGSWDALWSVSPRDGQGNAASGATVLEASANCYVRSEDGILIATLGVEDLIVIATSDAVLVAKRERAQDVKLLVDRLKQQGSTITSAHRRVVRPWGAYESIDAGERHQVKHITVKPGQRLSLQQHSKRAEHWIVVRGTAQVTRGEDVFTLHENQSTYIPLGTRHRLENPTDQPLHLIEVQSGSYLGEDDIVRFDDKYGRD
jgi:mannose-1-phosphate guanylyltransferase/mannose-1-phosphate guanylyltransferase/mannose-6-phosphate isomerase